MTLTFVIDQLDAEAVSVAGDRLEVKLQQPLVDRPEVALGQVAVIDELA